MTTAFDTATKYVTGLEEEVRKNPKDVLRQRQSAGRRPRACGVRIARGQLAENPS